MPARKGSPAIKYWVVEGKYTDEWEELSEVHPEDGGRDEAYRLQREYDIAHPYAQHRVRPVRA